MDSQGRLVTLRVLAAAGGVLAGIGGAVHGVGEVMQGPGWSGSIFFESWTTGPIADNLGGEPGLSLVPDLLVSGLLTLGSAAALAWWSVRHRDHRYAGRVMAALSVLMLLVGGGVGPPTMGLLAALAAGAANCSDHRGPTWAHGRTGALLARSWPALFWLSLTDYVFLALGSLFVGVVLGIDLSWAFVLALLLTLLLMPLATLAGTAEAARGTPATWEGTTAGARERGGR
jgi:hypothetical protein